MHRSSSLLVRFPIFQRSQKRQEEEKSETGKGHLMRRENIASDLSRLVEFGFQICARDLLVMERLKGHNYKECRQVESLLDCL